MDNVQEPNKKQQYASMTGATAQKNGKFHKS